MPVDKTLSEGESFLLRLAEGLEALGPAETKEVLAEIRSLLAETTAETGGDEIVALARFGDPHVLATRILEERGVLVGGSTVPEAPAWKRTAALAIDIAFGLAGLFLLVYLAMYFPRYSGELVFRPTAARYALAGVAAAVWVAWWFWQRRRSGHLTTGVSIMGLRRIRVGPANRMVRARDIPGVARGVLGRIISTIAAVLVLVVLACFAHSFFLQREGFGMRDHMVQEEAVAQYTSDAAVLVSHIYQMVLVGEQPASIQGLFAPAAGDAARALLARHAQGKMDSYEIDSVSPSAWPSSPVWKTNTPCRVVMLVSALEYARGSNAPVRCRYQVVYSTGSEGEAAEWDGCWHIESLDLVK